MTQSGGLTAALAMSIIDGLALADELARNGRLGLRRYETRRRAETADVVAANREMFRASDGPDDLAEVTARYRNDTRADGNPT